MKIGLNHKNNGFISRQFLDFCRNGLKTRDFTGFPASVAGYDLIPAVFLLAKGNGCDDSASTHAFNKLEHVLIIMALFTPFFALVYPGSSLMQALRKAGQAMANTVFRNIIIVVLFASIAFTVSDIEWIWYALFIGETIGGFMMLAHARSILNDLLRREKRRLNTNEC